MQNKYYIIIAVVAIIIIGIIIFMNFKDEDEDIENIINNGIENISNLDENEIKNMIEEIEVNDEKLEEIKSLLSQINSTANPNIYTIEEEYDGRKILQIKPEVQYEVDLAGIIKNDIPTEDEIDTLLKQAPRNSGIWISNSSREKFEELLDNNNITSFEIKNDGYLQCNKENNLTEVEEKLKKMIDSDKLYIIDMSGKTYQRDYITGEIIEYPFEDMDSYQVIEPYKNENAIILVVTANKEKKLSNEEILESIIAYSSIE